MSAYILFALLGLGAGAVYALLAVGLVVQQRSSGVINFAHGAVAMFVAYVYVRLRTDGELVFPMVNPLGSVRLAGGGIAAAPAVAISLVYAAILGALIYVLVFRRLRNAPVLGKVVASVGLMLLLQGLAIVKFGTISVSVDPILPHGQARLLGVSLPADRLWLAAVAAALAASMWALYRFSAFGLATRAAAESEQGATLLGYSADRLAVANWALATVLAGLAGILIAPISALDPGTYTLFVVPALAVALAARFASFPVALVTGLVLGMAQSEMLKLQTTWSWFPQQGAQDALPFLVIVLVMAFRGRSLPGRGALTEFRLPSVPRPRATLPTAGASFVAGLLALLLLHGSDRLALILSMQLAVVGISVVLLTGFLGQISLAQMAFAGVGGFVLSKLASHLGVPFPLSIIGAALAATPLGLLIGFPALRIRGVNLAIVTIGLAVALDEMVFQNPTYVDPEGSPVPKLTFLGANLDISARNVAAYPRLAFGLVVLVVLVLVGAAVARLPATPLGRRMLAVRADEGAAAAVGVNVAATKLIVFALSAFIAGLGGGLLGYQEHVLSAESFGVFVSLQVLAITYIGGITRVSGAVLGCLWLASNGLGDTLLDRWFGFGQYQLIVAGLGLILMAVINRDGIAADTAHLGRLAVGALSRLRATLMSPRGAARTEGEA